MLILFLLVTRLKLEKPILIKEIFKFSNSHRRSHKLLYSKISSLRYKHQPLLLNQLKRQIMRFHKVALVQNNQLFMMNHGDKQMFLMDVMQVFMAWMLPDYMGTIRLLIKKQLLRSICRNVMELGKRHGNFMLPTIFGSQLDIVILQQRIIILYYFFRSSVTVTDYL